MKVLVCHPGTQHAGKLAAILKRQDMLATFFTGFRVKQNSMLGRRLRLSGLRALDKSLEDCTRQIRLPELLAKAAQCLGWHGERLMRLRNAWFQKLIPESAIASSDAVIGFDTSSWILAKRARMLGKPFVLDRTAIHRSTRVLIGAQFVRPGIGAKVSSSFAGDVQGELESEEMTLASKVVVASRFSGRSVLEAGIGADKITVIPYGVDWEWFANGEKNDGPADKLIFLFVGLLKEEKGIAVLLAAWKQLGASDAELWLVGSGEAGMIQAAQGVPGVKVLGKLAPPELRQTYQAASVFVFPTYYDGFGMVLLEAMSSGLPIIATPHCAAPELIHDGEAGVICPAGDVVALCGAMADACAHRSAWRNKGAVAKGIAKSYSWETYGTHWATLLREVIA